MMNNEFQLNTKKYKNIIKSVVIDDREQSRIPVAEQLYSGLNPVVDRLVFGDYCFKGYNGRCVCFEFKTASDFLASIDDSFHLENQVYSMVNYSGYDFCFVIVAGDVIKTTLQRESTINRMVTFNQINGVTSNVLLSCPILYVHDDLMAFDLMMRISGKFIQNPPVKYKYHRKSSNTALNLLSSIHGLNNKADKIVETLNLETVSDVFNLTFSDLIKVDGIGDSTANHILTQIHGEKF